MKKLGSIQEVGGESRSDAQYVNMAYVLQWMRAVTRSSEILRERMGD